MITVPLRESTACDDGELQRRATEDGYLFFRGGVERALVRALRGRVVSACEARGWIRDGKSDPALRLGAHDDARWVAFLCEVLVSDEFARVRAAPLVTRVLELVFADAIVAQAGDLCRLVSPGATDLATPPHQDAAYLKGTRRTWTAWMPLGDCPRGLGPLAIAPGSHTQGLLPHGRAGSIDGVAAPEDARWACDDLREGDVLLFSCFTLHRALPNVTRDRLRMSVDYRYRPRSEAT